MINDSHYTMFYDPTPVTSFLTCGNLSVKI